VAEKCAHAYENYISAQLEAKQQDIDSKLWVYSLVKKEFKYENYLDETCKIKHELTNLYVHWLPIERLRYAKPKIERNLRICTLCKS
jgi:hypothetical protein